MRFREREVWNLDRSLYDLGENVVRSGTWSSGSRDRWGRRWWWRQWRFQLAPGSHQSHWREERRIRGFLAVSIVRETHSSCVSLHLIGLFSISGESDGPWPYIFYYYYHMFYESWWSSFSYGLLTLRSLTLGIRKCCQLDLGQDVGHFLCLTQNTFATSENRWWFQILRYFFVLTVSWHILYIHGNVLKFKEKMKIRKKSLTAEKKTAIKLIFR